MYNKLLVSVAGAMIMLAYQYFDDAHLTNVEWVQVLSAGVAAFLVWLTANGPKGTFWNYAKTAAFGVTALLATLLTVLPDGMNSHDWFTLAISLLTGLGVFGVSGAPVHNTETDMDL